MTLPPLSLRGKLFAFAALLILVPGVLLGLLAERSARDSLQTVIGHQLDREAIYTADRLSTFFRSERSTVESFARQDLMREIRVGDIDKRVSQALATLREGSDSRLGYFVVDTSGRVVAASEPRFMRRDASWRASLAPLLEGRSSYGGPIDVGGDPSLAIATRIPDPDGGSRDLGNLVGLIDWRGVIAILDAVRGDLATREVAASLILVGSAGAAIATSGPAGGPTPATRASSLPVDAGDEWIVGSAGLDADVPPWQLHVVESLAHALAPARELTRRLALTMALALAAALVIATLAARRVVRPLSELEGAIRGMARGDIRGASVPVRSDDEVGVLARAFNQMAADLDRAQGELVEAEKFAFVGELASGVAHEVRTSLGVLRSSAQMLEQSMVSANASRAPVSPELIGMISEEVGRLGRVVDDLLTLDRPRALHPEPTPLSLPALRAAEFVEPQAQQKQIQIEVKPADVDPIVACDREALQSVCVNLLVNAVQSLDPGGRIALEIDGPAAGFASLRVSDDGPGIPEELREKIFTPFVTGRANGVGLGLTFVKRVVHEHGGRIRVEQSPLGGACFRIDLPLSEEAP